MFLWGGGLVGCFGMESGEGRGWRMLEGEDGKVGKWERI